MVSDSLETPAEPSLQARIEKAFELFSQLRNKDGLPERQKYLQKQGTYLWLTVLQATVFAHDQLDMQARILRYLHRNIMQRARDMAEIEVIAPRSDKDKVVAKMLHLVGEAARTTPSWVTPLSAVLMDRIVLRSEFGMDSS